MSDPEYTPPESEELGGGDAEKTPVVQTGKKKEETAKTVTPVQPSLEEVSDVIVAARMVNAKKTATTDVIVARIEKHIQYLAGKVGFRDDDERRREQESFIVTIGETLKLSYEEYVVVTDHLVSVVRQNRAIFADGTAFRYTRNLSKNFPAHSVSQYRNYMTMWSMITGHWQRRHRLNSLIDITYMTKDLPRVGKENVTQYFNALMNV
jgi:hypothetical protein